MTDKEKNTLKKGIVGIFDKFNVLDHSSTIGGLKNDILSFINSMQQEPLRIKEGCRYRCLRNILNTDTGKFSFVKGKIYSSPRNDILIEETGVLCNTSEDSSGFELVEEPESKFEQSIQEGDNIVYNEDLGCRVNLSQLDRVAKKEEPVSEDMWEASKQYALRQVLASTDTKMSEQAYLDLRLFSGFELAVAHKDGAKWQKENLWKPAAGDDLPEYDREVIAILDYDFGHYKVVYAHRPNPNGWNGTNIDTEEKEHFEPEIYNKGGWNQPHVLYWLDTNLPYEENKLVIKED